MTQFNVISIQEGNNFRFIKYSQEAFDKLEKQYGKEKVKRWKLEKRSEDPLAEIVEDIINSTQNS